jgi:hypothetical protein
MIDCFIYIGVVAFGNQAEDFLIGQVNCLESLARFGGNPLSTNQELLRPILQKCLAVGFAPAPGLSVDRAAAAMVLNLLSVTFAMALGNAHPNVNEKA